MNEQIEPGAGWRLLDPDEEIQEGDEFWYEGRWNLSRYPGTHPYQSIYRRRSVEQSDEGKE